VTDDGVILHHMNAVITAKQRVDAERANLKAAYKAAQAAGINPKAIREAMRLVTLDHDDMIRRQQETAKILAAIHAPAQIDLVTMAESTVALPDQLDEAAREDGFYARTRNLPESDCPYGGDRAERWLEGWRAADASLGAQSAAEAA